MARKLIQVGVIVCLLLGPSAGALAVCPHIGCMTMTDSINRDDMADAHSPHHVNQQDHTEHAETHDAAQTRGVAANPHDLNCAHCASNREPAPSRSFKWQVKDPQTGRVLDAPRAVEQVALSLSIFVREFTPTQHAPPGGSARHLLLRVFRI